MAAKFIHITLALSVLFSSVGLDVTEHVCHREGKDFFTFLSQVSCCEDMGGCCSAGSSACAFKARPCCENFGHFLQSTEPQDVEKLEFKQFKVPQVAANFSFIDLQFFKPLTLNNRSIIHSSLPVFDLSVLYQVFRC